MLDQVWEDHLSMALTEAGVIAYKWCIETDQVEWFGNLNSYLGIKTKDYPKSNQDFINLINPGYVPQRLSEVRRAIDTIKSKRAGIGDVVCKNIFPLRCTDGRQVIVNEIISFQLLNNQLVLCGTLCFSKSDDMPSAIMKQGASVDVMFDPESAFLCYQPIMCAQERKIIFYESLIRLIDSNNNIIPANNFILSLEENGLCEEVDIFSMKAAIRELKKYTDLKLTINVSKRTLENGAWLHTAVKSLRDYPSLANRLMLEVTETALVKDFNLVYRAVRILKDLGCMVALDDFGVGYTSYKELQKLPLDFVKIDKSFVKETDKINNIEFIKTLVSLCNTLGLKTVGEGVETFSQANILSELGTDYLQGYAFGHPSADRIWLERGHIDRDSKLLVSKESVLNKKGDINYNTDIAA